MRYQVLRRQIIQDVTHISQQHADGQLPDRVLSRDTVLDVTTTLTVFPIADFVRSLWPYFVMGLFNIALAVLVLWLRPTNMTARIFFLSTIAFTAYIIPWLMGLSLPNIMNGLGFWMWIARVSALTLLCGAVFHIAYILPRPDKPFTWWLKLAYVGPYIAFGIGALIYRLKESDLGEALGWWYGDYSEVLPPIYIVAAVIVFGIGYVRATPHVKEQVREVFVVGSTTMFVCAGLVFIPAVFFGITYLDRNLLILLSPILNCAFVYALLRRQLFGIDRLVSRILTYALLLLVGYGVTVVVSLIVLALSHTISGAQSDLMPQTGLTQFLIVALVLLCIAPLRTRTAHFAERVVFGQGREKPYEVLRRLTQLAKSPTADEAVLTTIATTMANAFKLRGVAISRRAAQVNRSLASYGDLSDAPLPPLPLIYQDETVGELTYTGRAPGEALTARDLALLADFAPHIAVIVHTLRLAEDLAQARTRIAEARLNSTRDVRQVLHDTVGPELSVLGYSIDAVRNLLHSDTAAAERLLAGLRDNLSAVIPMVRDLAYDMLPPQSGVVAALSDTIQRRYPTQSNGSATPRIWVRNQPEVLPPLLPEIEMEVLQIILLALANVVAHAHATECCITIVAQPTALQVTIEDDGSGLPPQSKPGVGMTSMRERAQSIGGEFSVGAATPHGTNITVTLPYSPPPQSEVKE